MAAGLDRFAPLTGVVFAVVGATAFATANGAPDKKATGEAVVAFAKANSSAMQTSDVLWVVAFAFLVLFAGTLRSVLRETPALGGVVLAGAAMFAVGAAVYFGCDFALGADGRYLEPAAAQALNALALFLVLPMCVGGFVFGLSSGLGLLRGTQLPRWLGWFALLLGLVAMTPAALAAVVGFFLWAAVTGVLIFRRAAAVG